MTADQLIRAWIEKKKQMIRCACLIVCVVLLVPIIASASGQEAIDVYFSVTVSTTHNDQFDKTFTNRIKPQLNDKTEKPEINASHIKQPDLTGARVHSVKEYALKDKHPKNKKWFVLEISLNKTTEEGFIIARFDLFEADRNVHKPWVAKISMMFIGKDEKKINEIVNRIKENIRGKPYKILFTYCFDHSDPSIDALIADLPEKLTNELNRELDKSFKATAIQENCANITQKQKEYYPDEYYDYTIDGRINPVDSKNVDVYLNVRKEGTLIEEVKSKVGPIPIENFSRELATRLLDQWPVITKGDK